MPKKHTITIGVYILTYFTISIGLGFFSSYYLSSKNYNFRFPLFITSMQNLIHFIMSNVVILCMRKEYRHTKRQSVRSYITTTLPCAISAAIDIGIGSYALRTVSLAYYTMIKSSSPVFVLLCGFIFGVEKPSIKLFLVVFVIGIGVFLTTIKTEMSHIRIYLGDTTFMLLFASFMGGFRWAFIQYIMQRKGIDQKNKCDGKIDKEKNVLNVGNEKMIVKNCDTTCTNDHSDNSYVQNIETIEKDIDFYRLSIDEDVSNDSKEKAPEADKQSIFEVERHEDKCIEHKDEDDVKTRAKDTGKDPLPCASHARIEKPNKIDNEYPSVIETIRSLCIPIGCFLFLFSCLFEGMRTILTSEFFMNPHSIKINTGYILLTGVLTFTLLVSEFLLVSKTSVIFLSVCGIVKELLIVIISVYRKDINFERTNYIGLCVSIFGMMLYNYTRMKK